MLCFSFVDLPFSFTFQYQLEKVDITLPENKRWYKMYRFDIPVFHLNNKFLMKHRVDHEKLNSELLKFEEPGNNK